MGLGSSILAPLWTTATRLGVLRDLVGLSGDSMAAARRILSWSSGEANCSSSANLSPGVPGEPEGPARGPPKSPCPNSGPLRHGLTYLHGGTCTPGDLSSDMATRAPQHPKHITQCEVAEKGDSRQSFFVHF